MCIYGTALDVAAFDIVALVVRAPVVVVSDVGALDIVVDDVGALAVGAMLLILVHCTALRGLLWSTTQFTM